MSQLTKSCEQIWERDGKTQNTSADKERKQESTAIRWNANTRKETMAKISEIKDIRNNHEIIRS